MPHDHHDSDERYRCAICQAEFGSTAELIRHEKDSHTQHGSTAATGSDPKREQRPRREFTRRNME